MRAILREEVVNKLIRIRTLIQQILESNHLDVTLGSLHVRSCYFILAHGALRVRPDESHRVIFVYVFAQ